MDDGLDAAWHELGAHWDDDAAHDRFVLFADRADALPAAARRYRDVVDEAKKARAERQLGRITAVVVAKLHATKRSPETATKPVTIGVRLLVGLLVALAIYATMRAITH